VKDVRALEDRYQLRTYRKAPLVIERGRGCWVTDSEGRRYLDLYGGHAVALTGHCHPKVVRAIAEQAKQLIFYSNVVYNPARAAACEALVKAAPRGLTQVFLCNSGTEANETALKIARRFTGREAVVSFEGSFHGRTLGSLSATALPHYRENVKPLVPEHTYLPFGDVSALEAHLTDRVAAVLIEPVQSMAGCRVASPEFYRRLRHLTAERGIVLVFDEVQTGFGRTGKMFAGEHWGVTPDLITFAKGAGSGVPIGGVLVASAIAAAVKIGEQGTTFGGGPLACAAATATLGVVRSEKLVANARTVGARLRRGLEKLPGVQGVSGLGLMLTAKLDRPALGVLERLREAGVLAGGAEDKNALRLLPPLTLTARDADLFLTRLRTILQEDVR
jgi:acetylornithine/N-succinyldiaminopimelate aminotransferase